MNDDYAATPTNSATRPPVIMRFSASSICRTPIYESDGISFSNRPKH
jgi:hypothetical protein